MSNRAVAQRTDAAYLLRQWRGERSLREAADALGLSHQTVANYEQGERKPPLDVALRLSDVAGIPVAAWGDK